MSFRITNQGELRPFLGGQQPLATEPGLLAAGSGLVLDGTVLQQEEHGRLRPADGNSRLVAGILIGKKDASAGQVPVTIVTRASSVVLEGLRLPDWDEQSGLMASVSQAEAVILLLWFRLRIAVQRRGETGPMHAEIADWKDFGPASRWM